jgi:predicted small lipoprotein YifL
MRRAALFLFAVTLAGCGLREPLEPPPGQGMPVAPAMSRQALTTEEMLTPPPVARPERVTELLSRSEERRDDRFDLPPGEIPPGENPVRDEHSDHIVPSDVEAPE